MKNPNHAETNLSFGSEHSALGAFLFCVFFIHKLLKGGLDERDTNITLFYVLTLASSIFRHHSPFLDIKKDLETLPIKEFELFLKSYQFEIDSDIVSSVFNSNTFTQLQKEFAEGKNDKAFFYLFTTVNLNFSLLTAGDYYATGDYMSAMRVEEYGVLSDTLKGRIDENFHVLKDYNKNLFENYSDYLEYPFKNLQSRNEQNLNILRQKLNAEVISQIRKNPKNNWYYIEAPTGAGKTNLSLACINELLLSDNSINKVFYVFPFTTLITQTFKGIKETIGLTNNELIQLHSKAGFHQKEVNKDGVYGDEKITFLDNLFANYPFSITTHVKFFEVLKGTSKEANYLYHRLCNSIIVLDEIQSYDPKHWDKMIYFFEHIAPLLNIRFIIMSATLPKIDALSSSLNGKVISLTPNKGKYFTNPNFSKRVHFNFSLVNNKLPSKEEKEGFLNELSGYIFTKAEEFLSKNNGKVRVLIEFITKNSASFFHKIVKDAGLFKEYKIYILSGDILEPRRREIIHEIKNGIYQKVLLISTQVIEAGVDIDMDLGFKNHALIDSDEQFAGRVNRNASKDNCEVFLFKCDGAKSIYGKDERYKQQQTKSEIFDNIEEILETKSFHKLYEKVFAEKLKKDAYDDDKLDSYLECFKKLDFTSVDRRFRLIDDNESQPLFIPLNVNLEYFEEEDHPYLEKINVVENGVVSGSLLFEYYKSIIKIKNPDFTAKIIDLKRIGGLLSYFTINVYSTMLRKIADKLDKGENSLYGFEYLLHYNSCYSLNDGFDFSNEIEDVFL